MLAEQREQRGAVLIVHGLVRLELAAHLHRAQRGGEPLVRGLVDREPGQRGDQRAAHRRTIGDAIVERAQRAHGRRRDRSRACLRAAPSASCSAREPAGCASAARASSSHRRTPPSAITVRASVSARVPFVITPRSRCCATARVAGTHDRELREQIRPRRIVAPRPSAARRACRGRPSPSRRGSSRCGGTSRRRGGHRPAARGRRCCAPFAARRGARSRAT